MEEIKLHVSDGKEAIKCWKKENNNNFKLEEI